MVSGSRTVEEKRSRGAIAVLAGRRGWPGPRRRRQPSGRRAALKAFREAPQRSRPRSIAWTDGSMPPTSPCSTRTPRPSGTSRWPRRWPSPSSAMTQSLSAMSAIRGSISCVTTEIKQFTTDHSYVAMQRKFGLISEEEAKTQREPLVAHPQRRAGTGNPRGHRAAPTGLQRRPGRAVFRWPACPRCRQRNRRHRRPRSPAQPAASWSARRNNAEPTTMSRPRSSRSNEIEIRRLLPRRADVSRSRRRPQPVTSSIAGPMLDDRFFIHEMISRSGMATIFKATDRRHKQTVAMKVPLMQFESDPGFFSRFQREEEIGPELNHPVHPEIYPGREEPQPAVHCDRISARATRSPHLLNSIRPMPERTRYKLASRICEALAYMHENGVIHRDLKPQNIMICYDGTIRIMDFGIARAAEGGGSRLPVSPLPWARPITWPPNRSKANAGTSGPISTAWAPSCTRCSPAMPPFDGEHPFAVMNARVIGDPVAPRKLNPKLSPQSRRSSSTPWSATPANADASAAALKADLDDPKAVVVTGRANQLRPKSPGNPVG